MHRAFARAIAVLLLAAPGVRAETSSWVGHGAAGEGARKSAPPAAKAPAQRAKAEPTLATPLYHPKGAARSRTAMARANARCMCWGLT